jgi:hypothetical protein
MTSPKESFDPEATWRRTVEEGSAKDPMLQDSKLLIETRVLVAAAESAGKHQARPRPLKYSANWWKQWQRATPMVAFPLDSRCPGAITAEKHQSRCGKWTASSEVSPPPSWKGQLPDGTNDKRTADAMISASNLDRPKSSKGRRIALRANAGEEALRAAAVATIQQRMSSGRLVGGIGVSPAARRSRTILALELHAEEASIIPRADVSRGGPRRRNGRAADFERDTSHDAPVIDGASLGPAAAASLAMAGSTLYVDRLHSVAVEDLLDQKHRTGPYAPAPRNGLERAAQSAASRTNAAATTRKTSSSSSSAVHEVDNYDGDGASQRSHAHGLEKTGGPLLEEIGATGGALFPPLPALSQVHARPAVEADGGAGGAGISRAQMSCALVRLTPDKEREPRPKVAKGTTRNNGKKQRVLRGDRAPRASVVFGRERRHLGAVSRRSPGPVYAPSLQLTKESDRHIVFALAKRGGGGDGGTMGHGGISDSPGPGEYQVPSRIGSGRAANVEGGALRPWDALMKTEKALNEAQREVNAEKAEREAAMAEDKGLGIACVELPAYTFEFCYASNRIGTPTGRAKRCDVSDEQEEAYPYRTFGYGCSMEEHVLYGQCLDGRCCVRSHVEEKMARRVARKKRQAARGNDEKRRAAITKELLNREKTSLHFACEHGKLDIVHQLCLHGAKLGAADEGGSTPLLLAAAGGHTRIVQRLLANAQYPHVTPLGFVSRRLPPAVNAANDRGRTPLHAAAEGGHHLIVKLLLEAGANAELQDYSRSTALNVCNSPAAFHLLRSRAEVYAQRERLEGVTLKRNVIESTNENTIRHEIKAAAKTLQRDVDALRKATVLLGKRVARADADVLAYKDSGALHFRNHVLEGDAELSGQALVDLCRDAKSNFVSGP